MEKFPDARNILGGSIDAIEARPASRTELERVHTPRYLDQVSQNLPPCERKRLGLPANPQLLYRSSLETGGTLLAARAALEDGLAANLAGGTHHAFPDRGLGYCVLNDVAVAIRNLQVTQPELHCLVVDTDAHQGNGTHAIFRQDPCVTTYSIHVGKNYPSKKEPGDYDVPLPRWVDSATYLTRLKTSLPPLFHQVEPDLVFWISGADNHENDRFGQMNLSTNAMAERDHYVLDLCRQFAAPVVVLYGGGYNRTPGRTARLHAQTIQIANTLSSPSSLASNQPYRKQSES